MADLWERLRAAQAKADQAPVPEAEAAQQDEPAPAGWAWAAPLVAERRLSFDLDGAFWAALAGEIDAEAWRNMLCFDTETTGLSGGAGTVPFLVGWASLTPGDAGGVPSVEVRQWFLRDLPGEPDLIAALDEAFQQARGLVSFNGASFDLPLLRSRWNLAGKAFPERPHRDDLHPSRRLWKRLLPSCGLSTLEQAVLGLHRIDDVPGSLVPALWFDYLRAGAAADFATPLEGVLRHHAQDVYSLLCLDLLLAAMRHRPEAPQWVESFGGFPARTPMARLAAAGLLHPDPGPRTPVDFWGLLRLKDEDAAERSLADAWESGRTEDVGLAWADWLKRRRSPRARGVWTELWEARHSYPALEELLKWLEHRERTPAARAQALELIEQALKAAFLPRVWREGLERRRARLQRLDRPAPP
jgi:uncharacterized protein YprB with RNaseH-like and TPR domain